MYHAPFDVRFPSQTGKTDTVVQPDICIICDKSKLDELGCNGAPDLIIEILSASTSKKDYTEKYSLYEEHGVKEYWIVSPEGFIEVFVLKDDGYEGLDKLFVGDELKSKTLPELRISLKDIFPEEL